MPSADEFLGPPPGGQSADAFLDTAAAPTKSADEFLAGKKTGFWAGFGKETGGLTGLALAPLTDGIPANMLKMAAHNPDEFAEEGGLTNPIMGIAGMAMKRVNQFLAGPDSKDLPDKAKQAWKDTVAQAKQNPGKVAGGVLKGVLADPELFFIPGMTEAKGAATAARVAEAAGASERGAAIAAKAGAKVSATATGAGIGAGSSVASDLGNDRPIEAGGIELGAGIGALAGAVAQVHPKNLKVRTITPEEIDAQLRPSAEVPGATTPEVHIEPTAEGYTARVEGQAEASRSFPTKAEAEEAAVAIKAQAAGYDTMDTVPRGTNTPEGARTSMMHENPFTPENMAKWVKPSGESAEKAGDSLLKFWGKAALAGGIGAGLGAWLNEDDPKTSAEFGAAITLIPRGLPRDRRISIEKVINERNGQLAVMARHTLQFKAAIDAEVPEVLRRNVISLSMEGDPAHPLEALNPAELKVAQSVRKFFNSMGETAVDAGVLKEMLTNYVAHVVVEDPAAAATQGSTIDKLVDILMGTSSKPGGEATGRQFAKQRRYPTFTELQTALRGSGLTVKTADIGEVMAIYSKAMFRAVTDKRMLEALKQYPVEGMPPMVMGAKAWLSRALGTDRQIAREPIEGEARTANEKLPPPPGTDVAPADHPVGSPGEPPPTGGAFQLPPDPGPGASAQRYAQRGPKTLVMPSELEDGNYTQSNNRQLAGLVIHKDIAAQLNFVFSARDPNDVTLGLMALNQASKRAIVSFSLFHAKSLYDAFVGDQGFKALKNPKARVQDALAMFRYGGDNGGIDHLLKGGLQIQIADDIARGEMGGALRRTAEVVDKALPVGPLQKAAQKGASAAAHKLADFNDLLDHFTFNTLQTGFKLITGLDAYERLIKKGVPPPRAGEMAASYSNDIYGSLDWFRVANEVHSKLGRDAAYMFFNPNGRRVMQLAMFAPDWTISTFRAAYKALPGAVDDENLAQLHRRYLVKSSLYYLTVANGLNYALAGHSVFDNENPTRIQLADKRTMQFSKHFMEAAEWLRDPVQTADNKLGFIPRTAIEVGINKQYVSAHDSAPDLEDRAGMIANQFLPINVQQGKAGGGPESALGLVGMPIYGKTADQKIEAKKDKRLENIEKKKKRAAYYQRLNR
jgi:hypothetical protein